jgi:hypothetical protein
MGWTISDCESAAAALARIRELAARIDLEYRDPLYQAGRPNSSPAPLQTSPTTYGSSPKAGGRAATWPPTTAAELADRERNADVWASDHLEDHHAGVPAGQPHTHDHDDEFLAW